MYLTRKCLIEIKKLLYKSVLAKTAAAAHDTEFQTIQHKTDNILKKRFIFLDHSTNKTKTKTQVINSIQFSFNSIQFIIITQFTQVHIPQSNKTSTTRTGTR